jgi:hypothetical protein
MPQKSRRKQAPGTCKRKNEVAQKQKMMDCGIKTAKTKFRKN